MAQLSALDASAGVIAVGGKKSGTLDLLLKLAEAKNKAIMPLGYIGGTSADYLRANEWIFLDRLEENHETLSDIGLLGSAPKLFEIIAQGAPRQKNPKFFISYPRARPQEADYIETLLRRRGHAVYRDEETFEPSAETPQEISRSIKDSTVFIAIWCKEYACSPWCFDELEIGIERFQKNLSDLWIFCVDGTRMVPKEARNMNYYLVENRKELEGKFLFLLNKTSKIN